MESSISISGDGNVVGDYNNLSVNKTMAASGATVGELAALLREVRTALSNADFDEDAQQVMQADLDVVEGQIVKAQPNKSIIEAKLKSIAEILNSATTIGTSATTLYPHLARAIEMVQQLF